MSSKNGGITITSLSTSLLYIRIAYFVLNSYRHGSGTWLSIEFIVVGWNGDKYVPSVSMISSHGLIDDDLFSGCR